MPETYYDANYSTGGNLETPQDADFSKGGMPETNYKMLESSKDFNYSTGGMMKTTPDADKSPGNAETSYSKLEGWWTLLRILITPSVGE